MFYCLQDRDTPQWAKATIVGALGYFIFPADGIPDAVPVIGFSDDLVVITAALGIVVMHIKPNIGSRQKGSSRLGSASHRPAKQNES